MTCFVSLGRSLLLLLALLMLSGCLPSAHSQSDEEKEAHFITGKSRVNAMDFPGAIESFEKALEVNPQSAQAHFELGMLYYQKEPDPARAIYHYEEYLKLQPNAGNREIVKGCVVECKRQLASTVSLGPVTQTMQHEVEQLIEENKRFIMIDKVHHPDAWARDDSYDHVAYNTEDPATILAALEKTYNQSSKPDPGNETTPRRGCIYQLQATPTSNVADDLVSSITFSDCSSLLVWAKPRQDRFTYPWIASKTFEEPGNVILLNDFVEGALVDLAIAKSWERSGF